MKKVIICLTIGSLFALYANGVFAATVKCTVTEITDNVVILDCGKKTSKLKVGDKVKMKTAKKTAVVEGC